MEAPADAAGGEGARDHSRIDRRNPEAQQHEADRRGRRRRRPRRRRRAPDNGEATSPHLQDEDASPVRGPPCVIDWSDRMEQAAMELSRMIIVSIFGEYPSISVEEVKSILTVRFGIEEATISVKKAGA
jgi:hypothetical protein